MPSSDLSHWLLLAQRLFHDLVALLCVPSTRFGHLFPPAGSPAFLWPSYSHLSRVPNLMGRDNSPTTSRLNAAENLLRSLINDSFLFSARHSKLPPKSVQTQGFTPLVNLSWSILSWSAVR